MTKDDIIKAARARLAELDAEAEPLRRLIAAGEGSFVPPAPPAFVPGPLPNWPRVEPMRPWWEVPTVAPPPQVPPWWGVITVTCDTVPPSVVS